MKLTTVLLLFLSLAFLVFGYFFSGQSGYLGRYGKKTMAMVIDNKEVNGEFTPVALFTTEEGYIVKHRFAVGKTEPTPPGTEIEILYDPRDPNIADVNRMIHQVMNPLVIFSAGILCFILAVVNGSRGFRGSRR
jgi:hypothetical protein